MHTRMLFDVIRRQAGTLGKAILEGVMNSIDARATQITITLTADKLIIKDNGVGFQGRAEIEKFFEVFGQPPEADEQKRYGYFRLGRGQLFAFGRNTWRTDRFSMDVDINGKGLDYILTEHEDKHQDGCAVEVELYDKLSRVSLRDVEDGVKRDVKYAVVPITFNGDTVSKDPANEKWHHEDADAYYRFHDRGDLVIYNLGVLVCAQGSYWKGTGGEVVSKSQLKLNFARNDVLSDCPRWRRIQATIDKHVGNTVKKRKHTLTAAERTVCIRRFLAGDLDAKESAELSLFTDVKGKHHSVHSLSRISWRMRQRYTSAPLGDNRGDMLMQQGVAFVFADECLEQFDAATAPDLMSLLLRHFANLFRNWQHVDFETLVLGINDRYDLVAAAEYTVTERAIVDAIAYAQSAVVCAMSSHTPAWARRAQGRRIILGDAGAANAWTDGASYVAFDRRYLKDAGTDLGGWIKIGATLLHELCHDGPDSQTHVHSPEFYEKFHDHRGSIAEFVPKAMGRFVANLKKAGRRLRKQDLIQQDRLEAVSAARDVSAALG